MFKRKILLSPIIGLLITVIFYNLFLPVVCFADETEQSGQEPVNTTYNHKTSGVIVSMGDSYSAGEGIEPFYGSRYSEGWELQDWLAHRSEGSWGGQLRLPNVGSMNSSKYPEEANPHWYFVASSGAVTWDVTGVKKGVEIVGQDKTYKKYDETTDSLIDCTETIDPQINIFNETQRRQIVPDYITMTLGGNDLGFVDILKTAAINCIYLDPCSLANQLLEAIDKLTDFEIKDGVVEEVQTGNNDKSKDLQSKDKVRDRIKKIYFKIDEAASIGDDHPYLLVAGYPHLLNEDFFKTKPTVGDVANAFYIFTPLDARQLNIAIDLYCKVLQKIVEECKEEGLRIEYVDLNERFNGFDGFNGHEVNTVDPWINGIEFNSTTLGGIGIFPKIKDFISSGTICDALKKVLSDEDYKKYKKEQDLMSLLVEEKVFGNLTNSVIRDLLGIDYNQDLTYGVLRGSSLHPNSKGADGYKMCFQRKINELEGLNKTPSDDPPQTEPLIGSEITFGNYAGEDIRWTIMDETDNGYFLLAKNAIETKDFNDTDENTTWKDCSLRGWLNGEFYDSAFTAEEKELIQLSNVKNPGNSGQSQDDTKDHVFLLSLYEAEALFNTDEERMVLPTEHAYNNAKGVHSGEDIAVLWWLRSPGRYSNCAAYVDNWGRINYEGLAVADGFDGICGVRPALWISKDTPTHSSSPVEEEVRIGSQITMGNYRGEDIEWIVLDSKDDNLLVISKDIIEAKPFNNEDADVTWETCTLRKWLNEDFYQTAFSSSEREQIQRTHVVTPDDPISGADGGNDTDDYIFVLSTEEARTLFASDDDRKAVPKDYLSEQELGIYEGYGHWWLRSPSSDTVGKYATQLGAAVGSDGYVDDYGEWITTPLGIRPVMWIEKNNEPAEGDGSDPASADKATLVRDGDVVIFGQYEQDGNTGNGKEPIEWEILTEKDGKMLLISKYILDCQPYNTESTEVTWETCSLRQWLNNDFYNTAFNESDRKLIETTTLSNPDNPFGGKGGNSTDDKVFCLSMEEVYSYLDILYETDSSYSGNFCFSLDFLREVTPYARDRGVVHREIVAGYFDFTEVPIDESDLIGKDFGNWWLRSPAKSNDWACVVFLSGQAGYQDVIAPVGTGSEGVRPAIWVSKDDIKDT